MTGEMTERRRPRRLTRAVEKSATKISPVNAQSSPKPFCMTGQ
jgi:hypothetical protein